jgi:hypothetical protein
MIVIATSAHTFWTIALVIGLVAALVVAALLVMLLQSVGSIEKSVNGLLENAGKVAANTEYIPQLQATAPVLAQIVDEAVVQDGYMNALTDGYGDAASVQAINAQFDVILGALPGIGRKAAIVAERRPR